MKEYKIKLKKSKIILTLGPLQLDKQDLGIVFGLTTLLVLLFPLVGEYAFFGLIITGVVFRNVLLAKGHIRKK